MLPFRHLLFSILAVFAIQACQPGPAPKGPMSDQTEALKGHWINTTFLTQAKDTILGYIPNYCTELNFVSEDSVDINNGFETYRLQYIKNGDSSFILNHARPDYDMNFRLAGSRVLVLSDSVTAPDKPESVFQRVAPRPGEDWAFQRVLNDSTIAGIYTLYQHNQSANTQVEFTSDGKIKGLPSFQSYSVCYAGDCLEMSDVPANILSLTDSDGQSDFYAWTMDYKAHHLQVFQLAPEAKDTKGERGVTKQVLDLH